MLSKVSRNTAVKSCSPKLFAKFSDLYSVNLKRSKAKIKFYFCWTNTIGHTVCGGGTLTDLAKFFAPLWNTFRNLGPESTLRIFDFLIKGRNFYFCWKRKRLESWIWDLKFQKGSTSREKRKNMKLINKFPKQNCKSAFPVHTWHELLVIDGVQPVGKGKTHLVSGSGVQCNLHNMPVALS